MHKAELMKLYEFINLAYNKEPPLPTEIEMLMPLFENYSFAEMQRAAQQHIRTMLSAPKPSHLIKIVEENKQAARRASCGAYHGRCGRRKAGAVQGAFRMPDRRCLRLPQM